MTKIPALAGIYFHIPFCSKACHYCDFHFSTSLGLKSAILEAMKTELQLRLESFPSNSIHTVYFGGGTPSLLSDSEIGAFLEQIDSAHPLGQAEITLEANPDDLSREKLRQYREIGVNRLSIGIQSFHEEDLVWMNRSHTAAQALACMDDAGASGFTNFNADLIFGYPLLSDEKWLQNIQTMLQFPVTHLSCYSMTVEPGTALHHFIARKKENPLSDTQAARQYSMLMEYLGQQGWDHYEVSNFSLPGRHSRHNSAYWSGEPYLGIGPSAHGFDGKMRYWNRANNALYLKSMAKKLLPQETELLSPTDQHNEFLLTRLRTSSGLDRGKFLHSFGDESLRRIDQLTGQETMRPYFVRDQHSIRLNREGFLLADYLIGELFITEKD